MSIGTNVGKRQEGGIIKFRTCGQNAGKGGEGVRKIKRKP